MHNGLIRVTRRRGEAQAGDATAGGMVETTVFFFLPRSGMEGKGCVRVAVRDTGGMEAVGEISTFGSACACVFKTPGGGGGSGRFPVRE